MLLLFCMAQTPLHCSTTTIKPSANSTLAAVQDSPSHFAFSTHGFRILKMPEEHRHAQDGIKKGMKVENSNLVQGICPNQNPGFPSNWNSPCRQKPVPSCHMQDAGPYFFWVFRTAKFKVHWIHFRWPHLQWDREETTAVFPQAQTYPTAIYPAGRALSP